MQESQLAEGMEMGLSIIQRIMAIYNGAMTMVNVPGQDATFLVQFPNILLLHSYHAPSCVLK